MTKARSIRDTRKSAVFCARAHMGAFYLRRNATRNETMAILFGIVMVREFCRFHACMTLGEI